MKIFGTAHRSCPLHVRFVSTMAFFARISDPAIGGTYMTFLNTLTNLGNMWPNSFTLWFVDFLTWKVTNQEHILWNYMWQSHLKEHVLTGSYLKECIPDLDKAAADSSKSPLASSALVSTNATLIAANRCFFILNAILQNSIFIYLNCSEPSFQLHCLQLQRSCGDGFVQRDGWSLSHSYRRILLTQVLIVVISLSET